MVVDLVRRPEEAVVSMVLLLVLFVVVVVLGVKKTFGICFDSHHMKAEVHPEQKSQTNQFSLKDPLWLFGISENVSMRVERFIVCNVSVSPNSRTTSVNHRVI